MQTEPLPYAVIMLKGQPVATADGLTDLPELLRLHAKRGGEVYLYARPMTVVQSNPPHKTSAAQIGFDFDASPPVAPIRQQLSILGTRPQPVPPPPTDTIPNLAGFDWILVNSSGGKDSQAMLDYVAGLAAEAGVSDRVVVVHVDLGRVEWEGTRDLAEKQARHYGLRFEVVRRDRDLLHQIEHERKKFPDSARRFCTSDQKTSQVVKLITRLVTEAGGPKIDWSGDKHRVRILNCLGMRAQESPKRAKMPDIEPDECSNGKREVVRWLPIHNWTTDQVWARIKQSGVPHHWAYDKGMPRLSCSFCVLASKGALILAAKLRPEMAAEYVRIETAIGHTFKRDLSMAEIVRLAQEATGPVEVGDWKA